MRLWKMKNGSVIKFVDNGKNEFTSCEWGKEKSIWHDKSPIYGSIVWPIFMFITFFVGHYGLALFGAFWFGISFDRLMTGSWRKE